MKKLSNNLRLLILPLLVLLFLSSCIENNIIKVRNGSSSDIVVDYYHDEEDTLKIILGEDEEDDIDDRDEDDSGPLRVYLTPDESETISASREKSVYIFAGGVVFKYDSSKDITIYNETIEEKAIDIYEVVNSK